MENMDKIKPQQTEVVYAPLSGQVMDISKCEDPLYAQQFLGKGVLILPTEGKLYSPVDGTVSMLTEKGHAIGITSANNIDILIHIGLDTIELDQEIFTKHVKRQDEVKKGDLLLEFDYETLKKTSKSLETPIIIANLGKKDLSIISLGDINHGDGLLEINE